MKLAHRSLINLLRVGERSRPVRGLAALAERISFFEWRFDEMTPATTTWCGPKAFLAGAVALAAVAGACASPPADEPTLVPYDVPPKLKNPREVQQALQRHYPRKLKEQEIGGRVVLWIFVNEQGEVTQAQMKENSGYAALDAAAKKVAAQMEFSPALNRGEKTGVWIKQPITFEVEGSTLPPRLTEPIG